MYKATGNLDSNSLKIVYNHCVACILTIVVMYGDIHINLQYNAYIHYKRVSGTHSEYLAKTSGLFKGVRNLKLPGIIKYKCFCIGI